MLVSYFEKVKLLGCSLRNFKRVSKSSFSYIVLDCIYTLQEILILASAKDGTQDGKGRY